MRLLILLESTRKISPKVRNAYRTAVNGHPRQTLQTALGDIGPRNEEFAEHVQPLFERHIHVESRRYYQN